MTASSPRCRKGDLDLISLERKRSVRQSRIWADTILSSSYECCVGLVLSSWGGDKRHEVTCMNKCGRGPVPAASADRFMKARLDVATVPPLRRWDVTSCATFFIAADFVVT